MAVAKEIVSMMKTTGNYLKTNNNDICPLDEQPEEHLVISSINKYFYRLFEKPYCFYFSFTRLLKG